MRKAEKKEIDRAWGSNPRLVNTNARALVREGLKAERFVGLRPSRDDRGEWVSDSILANTNGSVGLCDQNLEVVDVYK